jgi:hypothetical protein
MKKLIVVILALAMVMSVFVSCGDDTNTTTPKQTTPKTPGGDDIGDVEIPENEQMNLDLDAIDYEGETVHIFHWEGNGADFGMEQDDIGNDAVNDAAYRRNLQTETDLGIEIDWYKQGNSSYPKSTQFVDKLEARISDPQTPVDIIISGVRSMPFFLVEGHLTEHRIGRPFSSERLEVWREALPLRRWGDDVLRAFAIIKMAKISALCYFKGIGRIARIQNKLIFFRYKVDRHKFLRAVHIL